MGPGDEKLRCLSISGSGHGESFDGIGGTFEDTPRVCSDRLASCRRGGLGNNGVNREPGHEGYEFLFDARRGLER